MPATARAAAGTRRARGPRQSYHLEIARDGGSVMCGSAHCGIAATPRANDERPLRLEPGEDLIGDVPADAEGGGCCRRGGVDDVNGSVALHNVKVVQQPARAVDGLRAHAAGCRDDIRVPHGRDEALYRSYEEPAAERAPQLDKSRLHVLPRHTPKTGERQQLHEIARRDVA